MRLFGAINKVERDDNGLLLISGVASSEAVDSDGEVVTAEAMRGALPEFMKGGGGPLREMHQAIAAGLVTFAEVQADGSTHIEAKVVDQQAIVKVDAGVLRGFSIGGKALTRDPADRHRIVKLRLTEISLVDRPANPDSVFKIWGASGQDEEDDLAVIKAALATPAAVGDRAVLKFWGMR